MEEVKNAIFSSLFSFDHKFPINKGNSRNIVLTYEKERYACASGDVLNEDISSIITKSRNDIAPLGKT